jgi:hypothetical protein
MAEQDGAQVAESDLPTIQPLRMIHDCTSEMGGVFVARISPSIN